jgi:hypothetical protein
LSRIDLLWQTFPSTCILSRSSTQEAYTERFSVGTHRQIQQQQQGKETTRRQATRAGRQRGDDSHKHTKKCHPKEHNNPPTKGQQRHLHQQYLKCKTFNNKSNKSPMPTPYSKRDSKHLKKECYHSSKGLRVRQHQHHNQNDLSKTRNKQPNNQKHLQQYRPLTSSRGDQTTRPRPSASKELQKVVTFGMPSPHPNHNYRNTSKTSPFLSSSSTSSRLFSQPFPNIPLHTKRGEHFRNNTTHRRYRTSPVSSAHYTI